MHCLRFGGYAVEFPPSEETFATENKFPFHYTEDESDEESDGEAFDPLWEVPDQLVMPKTKKLHAIIEATANKVQGHPQLESMLKIKLGDNKKFRF
ncbi:hypothetical protein F443_19792 [Phytophthora nicotianae P1569]|uniref:Uncharacterized protein n=3 Tax=Phytophthora nicotianae TaxID=4792 RepID=V9E352_PHYNI|nr:hypothetical protein F443_19792 [Phytophthora nicotianae P1569]